MVDLARLAFRFAKTMPEIPHEYVVRTAENEDAYVELFHVIRRDGEYQRFQGRRYKYWRHDGFQYWAMTTDLAQSKIINPLGKPTYIVAAKHDAHFLSGAEPQPIMHRGSPAWLAIVNAPAPPPCKTTLDVLEWLGATYRSVYDFTCGYGRSLRYFHYAIGSDIDRKCLAYAAGHILGGEGEIKSQLNP